MALSLARLTLALVLVAGAGAPAQAGTGSGLLGRIRARAAEAREQRAIRGRLGRIDPLLAQACRALRSAHAPYSGVRMGAAALVKRGGMLGGLPLLSSRVVRGFNSESEGDLQICAERAAVANLPRGRAGTNPVERVAVVGEKIVPNPCGRCLQVLSEVGTPETQIIAANLQGEHRSYRLKDLFPTAFEATAPAGLTPFRPLIARAVTAYRRSLQSRANGYRPPFGAAVRTSAGDVLLGMVIKDTASTFTPATRLPLDLVGASNALKARADRVEAVVIAGRGRDGKGLPLPTGDERQYLVDMNPSATVVLYNPHERTGAVLRAQDLLPHAYRR